jgi:uncharacterized protein (DUF488 family)
MIQESKTIWTIGHSTRTLEEFLGLLDTFFIKAVADIRAHPGSRKFPHFNQEALQLSLQAHHIKYVHIGELGGRRKMMADSMNTGWRNDSFRGYADYMETNNFEEGINQLQDLATYQRTAYMCSEAVWWRCHRSLVSDYLKIGGWTVLHIVNSNKTEPHPYSSPARIVDGKLSYKSVE